jgi:hypothetical protein
VSKSEKKKKKEEVVLLKSPEQETGTTAHQVKLALEELIDAYHLPAVDKLRLAEVKARKAVGVRFDEILNKDKVYQALVKKRDEAEAAEEALRNQIRERAKKVRAQFRANGLTKSLVDEINEILKLAYGE